MGPEIQSQDAPSSVLYQILVSWFQLSAGQQWLGRRAPWLDAVMKTQRQCWESIASNGLPLTLMAVPRPQLVSNTWKCSLASKFITCNLRSHLVWRIKFAERIVVPSQLTFIKIHTQLIHLFIQYSLCPFHTGEAAACGSLRTPDLKSGSFSLPPGLDIY